MSVIIGERRAGNVTILDLAGRITLGESADSLRIAINALLNSNQRWILLNFAGVTYIDSAGFGKLVDGYNTARNTGGMLALENAQQTHCAGSYLPHILLLTTLNGKLKTFEDDEDAAISSLAAPPMIPM